MEIKKAFETFKKEIKKELGLSGGFTMSAKQIANRTATQIVVADIPFQTFIDQTIREDERIQSYDTWTDAQKARSHEEHIERIRRLGHRLNVYGTPYNMAVRRMCDIAASEAFRKFQENVGQTSLNVEQMNGAYYIRFNY